VRKLCGRLLWGILVALVIVSAIITLSGLALQVVWGVGKCLSSM